jgi:hypothetical protein
VTGNNPTPEFWLNAIHLSFDVAIGFYVWWSNREKVTNRRFKAQEDKITAIETKIGNVPLNCSSHLKTESRLDGHNDRLSQHKELLSRIESEFKYLPKSSDLEKVYERINKIAGQMSDMKADVGKISGAMPGLTHITEMINDFLLTHGGKR